MKGDPELQWHPPARSTCHDYVATDHIETAAAAEAVAAQGSGHVAVAPVAVAAVAVVVAASDVGAGAGVDAASGFQQKAAARENCDFYLRPSFVV